MNNKEMTNLLVIGNGFDKHHNLPTSYKEFIYFLNDSKKVELLSERFKDDKYIDVFDVNKKEYSIKECINDNFWIGLINYLEKDSEDDKWSNLENLIRETIVILEELNSKQKDGILSRNYIGDEGNKIERFLLLGTIGHINTSTFSTKAKKIELDLRKLSFILQKYLLYIYDKEKIVVDKDIEKLIIDGFISHVLDFNYTSTLEDLYLTNNPNINVCHLHGTFDKYESFVFGTYLECEYSQNRLYLPFQKFQQTITKKSDKRYRQWEINNKYVYTIFYGFSFGEADTDTIKYLYENSSSFYIFYYDDKSFRDISENLTIILGRDNYNNAINNGKIIYDNSLSSHEFYNALGNNAFLSGYDETNEDDKKG